MAKTFKRIAALALALTLVVCFAVSASAEGINTKTTYVSGSESKVNVTVTVSQLPATVENVTYYATKDSTLVYVDQEKANNGSATFQFQTDAVNLKSDVKIGYTGSDAEDTKIDGFEVSANKGRVTPNVIPNSGNATVKIAYEATPGKTYDNLEVDGAEVVDTPLFINNVITVVLSGASNDVTITINEKDAIVPPVVEYLDGAAIVVTEENIVDEADANYSAPGTRKLTVIGKVTGTGENDEFGIAFSTDEITETNFVNAKYKALEKNSDGIFAVQLIDEGDDSVDALISSDAEYYVAIYAYVDGKYTISDSTLIEVN